MSEKNLTELEWKRFAKGRNLKDAAFVKSLADLERAKTPQAQLTALAEIEKQSDLLLKADKGDKELAAYLNEAGKAIEKQRKLSEFEVKKSVNEEDDEGPAALGAPMLPLLRQIAKGKDDGAALPVMVAVSGKEVVVLVARRAIGASQKKLLTEALGTSAGVKFMSGECVWEDNAHTFVLEAKVSNLAKGIKAALQKQTDTRFKVRVRGTDPHDVDEDGDDAEGGEGPEISRKSEDSPEKVQYLDRLRELEPQVTAALREPTGDAPKLKAVFSFAQGKAKEGQYPAALQGLEMVAKLLEGGSPLPTVPPAPPLPPKQTTNPELKTGEPSNASKKFNERVNGLLPRIKDGIAAHQPGAGEAKVKLSEAAVFARKLDWPAANALLDEIVNDLDQQQPYVPPLPSEKDIRAKELKEKEEVEQALRNVMPSQQDMHRRLERLIEAGDKRTAELVSKLYKQLREELGSNKPKAALASANRIEALTGSAEARRAELKHMTMLEQDTYKQSVDEQIADFTPAWLDQLRSQAVEEGYGVTSDGYTRYALPISVAEWQTGAIAPLVTVAQLLEQAASAGTPQAAQPFMEQILSEQWPVMKLAERARQFALDGGFDEHPRKQHAAWELPKLFGEFSMAVDPFMLVLAEAKDAGELQRSMEDLLPTLKDYPAPEGGTEPFAQLQQAIQACQAGEFTAAGALLSEIRDGLQMTRPTGMPGDSFNEQIASEGDNVQRAKVQSTLHDIKEELSILAAKKGLPFDPVHSALQNLDQAVRDFEALL